MPHYHGRYGFNALTREGDWEVIFKNYTCAFFLGYHMDWKIEAWQILLTTINDAIIYLIGQVVKVIVVTS